MNAFRRWAFDPIDVAPMAALRIACGLLVLGWTVSLLPDATTFLSPDGLTQGPVDGSRGWWTLSLDAYVSLGLLGVAAVGMIFGLYTRLWTVTVAFMLTVLQRRDVYVLNSGDLLLRELAIYLALMPCGDTWSLDARRRGSRKRAPWGLRLLQVQVSLLYLFSVTAKLHGTSWQNGSAVGKALQLGDLQRLVLPQAVSTSITVSAVLTYGTLVVEAFLVVALWHPRTRYVAMALGLSIHLGIEATLLIGWFSLTIISTYLAFIPGPVLRSFVARRGRPAAQPVATSARPTEPVASPASPRSVATDQAGGTETVALPVSRFPGR